MKTGKQFLYYTTDNAYFSIAGHVYTWRGWLGCQLMSYEWCHVRPGTTRQILNREFTVHRSKRAGFRVEVTWALPLSGSLADRENMIEAFRDDFWQAAYYQGTVDAIKANDDAQDKFIEEVM